MSKTAACNCVGPQNGQPRCPCMMNRRKEDTKKVFFQEAPSNCTKCGLQLKSSGGTPLVLGYVCQHPDCPCGLGGVQC